MAEMAAGEGEALIAFKQRHGAVSPVICATVAQPGPAVKLAFSAALAPP
jgi:hypothetical protein